MGSPTSTYLVFFPTQASFVVESAIVSDRTPALAPPGRNGEEDHGVVGSGKHSASTHYRCTVVLCRFARKLFSLPTQETTVQLLSRDIDETNLRTECQTDSKNE